jgi:DnaJ family protein C protein 2
VHDLSFEEHDKHVEEVEKRRRNLEQEEDEDDLGVGDEEETEDILSLDPKEWKVSRKSHFFAAVILRHVLYFLETRPL